jgi:hypothetical protein
MRKVIPLAIYLLLCPLASVAQEQTNYKPTYLTAALTISATAVTVNTTSGLPATVVAQVDSELLNCSVTNATTLTCSRSYKGTAAVAHTANSTMRFPLARELETKLDALPGIAVTSPTTGQTLRYNGSLFVNSAIQAGDLPTGIDAAKLADGSVSSAELQRLDGVTSGVQAQIDGKAAASHTHTLSQVTDAGTAASRNVAASGNASTTQVVKGDDTRLTDSRAPTSHTHPAADIVSGTVAVARLPVMVGSGASHAAGLVPDPGASAGTAKYLREDGTFATPPDTNSGGTVTSVALTTPGVFYSVSGSPVTGAGTLALALINQLANCVFAGPSSGASATPSCRALVAADLPSHTHAFTDITGTTTNAQLPITLSSKTFDNTNTANFKGSLFTLLDATDTTKQARFDLSNVATATTRTVNIPDANSTTAQAKSATTSQFITSMSAQGVFTAAQAAFTDISGTASSSQIPSLDASKITTGTMATARLGSGSASSSTYLRGDQSYATPVTSITGTTNQVTASASTGGVTLSLPQSIATSSDLTFNKVSIGVPDVGLIVTTSRFNVFGTTGGTRPYVTFRETAAGQEAIMGLDTFGLNGFFMGTVSNHTFAIRSNNTNRFYLTTGGDFLPTADNTYANGSSSLRTAATWTVKTCYTTAVCDFYGSGSPESVVTASVGSTYRRTDGGAATSFYVKESGTGATGWAAK